MLLQKNSNSLARASIVFALVTVVVAVVASGASGDGMTLAESQQQLELALEAKDAQKVDLDAGGSESAVGMPRRNLDRDEAEHLLSAAFEPQIQNSSGIFRDLDVAGFLSNNVAIVPASDGEGAALLESTLPLRAENGLGVMEVVDLELEKSGTDLRPENALVEVAIPQELGDGISLPGPHVSIGLVGGPDEREASTVSSSAAFYPNVAQDTDLTVAPTPTGVETLTQIRSLEAPTSQEFKLNLPNKASLQETQDGGAEIVRDDRTLMSVASPTALDAKQEPVPVSLDVVGDKLRLTVEPGANAQYPILVDPTYDYYSWANSNPGPTLPGWETFNTTGAWLVSSNIPWLNSHWGLDTISGYSGTVVKGSQANWSYKVPRYESDLSYPEHAHPTSYIAGVTLEDLELWMSGIIGQRRDSPYMLAGIWNPEKWGWVTVSYRNGIEGQLTDLNHKYIYPNSQPDTDAKWFQAGFASSEDGANEQRYLSIGAAMVELGDKDFPEVQWVGSPTKWVNNNSIGNPIKFSASDTGLGVFDISVGEKTTSGQTKYVLTHYANCTGGSTQPCSRSWTDTGGPALNFDPSVLPEGENWTKVTADDPVGHWSDQKPGAPPTPEVDIKVDHTPPSLALSGTLTEQATLGTGRSEYKLKYSAADGDEQAPAALTPFGSAGTGPGQLEKPRGIACDKKGHVWVVDGQNNRVVQYDEEGKYLSQFGSAGSGNGQFNNPYGIAISKDGNLWVTDLGNGRVQEFNAKGEYMQQFGTKGSSSSGTQFIEPEGIATTADGMLWVSDTAGHRLAEFRENPGTSSRFVRDAYGNPSNPNGGSDLGFPSGIAVDSSGNVWVVDWGYPRIASFGPDGKFLSRYTATEGSGNGQLKSAGDITIAPSGNLLVTETGNNRVQEFKPDGTYMRQFGSLGSGNAQFSGPRGIAFGQGNLAFIADFNNRRITKWSHPDLDPQSGVVSTEVKIDGNLVEPKYAPGCASKNCSISREWTLNANSYASGQHEVKVIATDGVGLTTTKSLTITTQKDTTAPQLAANSAFFTAPEGWLEQKSYSYIAGASDTGGFGVTSLALKIDGKTVKSVAQSCPGGGCGAAISGSINMAGYSGGAHPAELVATDAGGNVSKKVWTINVDPKGTIPIAEAINTLEAVESTSPVEIVEPVENESFDESGQSTPGIEETSEKLIATGTKVPATVSVDPEEGFTMWVLEPGVFAGGCSTGKKSEEEIEPCVTESEISKQESVHEENDGFGSLQPLSVQPVSLGSAATDAAISGSTVAVAANTNSQVDTVVRPLYGGAIMFESIRDSTGPESFSWEISLAPGQELKQLDETHAEIYYENEHPAGSITATPAHDAVGTEVPTKLTVSGANLVTLTVSHHKFAEEGKPFVYPIVSGAGWEGGFQTYTVQMPPSESPPESGEGGEESGFSIAGAMISEWAVSPPEHASPTEAGFSATELSSWEKRELEHRHFRFIRCHPIDDSVVDPGNPLLPLINKSVNRCGNPFARDEGPDYVAFNYAIRGDYFRVSGVFTKHLGGPTAHIDCDKMYGQSHFGQALIEDHYFIDPDRRCVWWGETKYSRSPLARNENGESHHITPYGEWLWGRSINGDSGTYSHEETGLALYIWSSPRNYIGHHETTCIDC